MDILEQVNKIGFIGLSAFIENNAVGFTWGYNVDKISMQKIAGHKKLDEVFLEDFTVIYFE